MLTDGSTRVHVDGKVHKPEPRGLLEASVEIDGKRLLLLTTHASIWPEERLMAARVAIERAANHDGPVVFAGDFNSECATNADIVALRGAFIDAAEALENTAPTFPSGDLAVCIDYIFLRDAKAISARVVPTDLTDHAALVVDIEIG
jgi:endonuclease/exonuclease/phosphatase (EEP) superfamily protein YafD